MPATHVQQAQRPPEKEREYDQVLRVWMPYDNGFLVFQPHVRNGAALAIRRTDAYGSPTIARLWLDK